MGEVRDAPRQAEDGTLAVFYLFSSSRQERDCEDMNHGRQHHFQLFVSGISSRL